MHAQLFDDPAVGELIVPLYDPEVFERHPAGRIQMRITNLETIASAAPTRSCLASAT